MTQSVMQDRSTPIVDSGATYVLTLRCDRPIESCEISPVPYLQLKGGNLDNNARNRLMDANPFYFSYTWFRGPKKQICANPRCPRGNTFEPVHWSKVALGGPELVCRVCEKNGKPGYDASFCSGDCFKQSWSVHSLTHTAKVKPASPTEEEGPTEPTELPVDPSGVSHWPLIHKERLYTPQIEDVGCRLRIQVTAHSQADDSVLAGPIEVFTDPTLSAPVAPPKKRLTALSGAAASLQPNSVRFRVVCYNVLAEIYASKQQYPHCDGWNLSWPYRRKLLLDELEETQGDVVCLQEVQADYYDQHLAPLMADLGYEGAFKAKSREGVEKGGFGKVDGCATFWKKSKFNAVEQFSIEFNDLARQEAAERGLDEAEARRFINRLSKDNIAQVTLLEAAVTRTAVGGVSRAARAANSLCVVNTHLHANVLRPDVKLWQSVSLMREVTNFISQRNLALLLCGDFNSEPTSAVYEYLLTGMVDPGHPDLHSHRDNPTGVRVLPADASQIAHSLDVSSAMLTGLGAEPAFTNYTTGFRGTLDYILYSTSRLRVLAITNLPEEGDLRSPCGEGLPNANYPSDHLMLCCDMALAVTGNGSLYNNNAAQAAAIGSMMGHLGGGGGGSSGKRGGYGRMK